VEIGLRLIRLRTATQKKNNPRPRSSSYPIKSTSCFDVVFTILNDKLLYFLSFYSGFAKTLAFLQILGSEKPFLSNMKQPRTVDELICRPNPKVKTFSHGKADSLNNRSCLTEDQNIFKYVGGSY
jgi:hypothetical protein